MKNKIFKALAVFISLGFLTSCSLLPNMGSRPEGQSGDISENDNGTSRRHTHKWEQDTSKTNVEATCAQEGIKYEKCECGDTRETKIPKLSHEFGEWEDVEGGICGQRGQQKRVCSLCHFEEIREVSVIPHLWEVKSTVAAGDGGVAYEFVECLKCHKNGLMVAASRATINGSDKGGAPDGCVKLNSNGQSMSVTINLEEAHTGTIYLRGTMDYWHDGDNDNQDKTYATCKTSSNTANFSLLVNDDAIDFSDMLSMTFGEMLPEEPGETIGSITYSQIGDCKVGACSLVAGLNTITFNRIDSYNLAIHDFLIIFD